MMETQTRDEGDDNEDNKVDDDDRDVFVMVTSLETIFRIAMKMMTTLRAILK